MLKLSLTLRGYIMAVIKSKPINFDIGNIIIPEPDKVDQTASELVD